MFNGVDSVVVVVVVVGGGAAIVLICQLYDNLISLNKWK